MENLKVKKQNYNFFSEKFFIFCENIKDAILSTK